MRILYFHQYFNTPDKSGSVRSYELASRLVKNGHVVHMITLKQDSYKHSKKNFSINNGINVHWLPVTYSHKMGFFRRIISFLTFSVYAVKQSLKIKTDLIFATSTPLTIAIPAIIIKKIRGLPLVFEARDLWPAIPIALRELKSPLLIFLSQWLERVVYRASKQIIALSPGTALGIQSTGIPQNRITIIPNAAELRRFSVSTQAGNEFRKKYPWLKNNPLIVYAGSLGRVNGVSYFVDIADAMHTLDSNVKFLIAGDGREKDAVISYAKKNGVYNKTMFFIPPVSKNELPSLLSAATVCTSLVISVPELTNNSANKFFDGLAAGKPIMINYGGWQKELLETNHAGIFVPFDNPQEGAKRLNDLIKNKNKLKEYGHSANRLAEEKFSIEILYKKFEKTILESAGSG